MRLEEIAQALDCETLAACGDPVEVDAVVASDGMSEILAFSCPGALMLTGLTNIQSVRTAVVADVHAIVYVRGKRPSEKVLELAREKGIPVLATERGMFDSCGILYAAGMSGGM
jgi:predicted transcriptional regulator